jgi:hypothetical protein
MSGQIFISYRREESRWSARSLYDRLSARFDRKQIFMDIDAIALGDDFVKAIEKTVGECDVLIAVIGAHWLTSTDEQNGRRLDNPEDFVRREIATALKRDIRVIPVLVDGALMPRSSELPDDLKPLVRRNALRVSDTGFDDDCRRLVAAIEQVLAERGQREEKERLEAERREIEAKEHLDAKRQQKEEKELLERKLHSPPPGPGAPSTSPSKIKLRPVAGIVALLALVIGLLVVYFGSQPPERKPTTPKPAVQPSSPVAVVTPSPETSANPTAPDRGALVTQGGALIAAPTVEEKTPSTSEVAVQPSAKPTTPVSRGTLLIH